MQALERVLAVRAPGMQVIPFMSAGATDGLFFRAAGIPAFTLMSCDNLPHNGDVTRKALLAFAHLANHELATWIDQWSQGFTRQGALVRPANRPAPADSVAYTVVPRAAWRASAERDRKVWLSTAPEQALSLQVARSFRSRHPGAGLLVKWLEAPLARRQVRALAPGWRLPGA